MRLIIVSILFFYGATFCADEPGEPPVPEVDFSAMSKELRKREFYEEKLRASRPPNKPISPYMTRQGDYWIYHGPYVPEQKEEVIIR